MNGAARRIKGGLGPKLYGVSPEAAAGPVSFCWPPDRAGGSPA